MGKFLLAFLLAAALSLHAQSATPSLREGRLEMNGASLFYVDSGGAGAPVVFLHSATGSVVAWEKQVAAITGAGFRFLAFDRRGWGKSTTGASAGTNAGTAADDLAALLDHLKIDRCHVLGTAAGGFAAFDFALSYPQRLRSLIIANSIGGMEDSALVQLGRRLRPPEFDALPPELRELGPAYRAADAAGEERWVQLEKRSRPEGPRVPAQPLKNHITLAALSAITAPTLFLTGGADLYAPPALQQFFAARVRNSKSVVLADVGHSGYWEQPAAFNRAVTEFLRGK